VFRSCKKDFYKASGKSQVGCLRTGHRHGKWLNQYKSSLHFSIPLSYLFDCNQFCLTRLKNIILGDCVWVVLIAGRKATATENHIIFSSINYKLLKKIDENFKNK